MKVAALEKASLTDFTYFYIVLFQDKNKPGHEYPNAYKTEAGAARTAEKLIKSGKYEVITLRRNEVIKQVPYTTLYSIDGPIKEFIKEA